MKRIFAVFTALLILCSGFYANAERNGSSSSKIGGNISDFVSETIHGENINGAVFAQKKITVLHYFSIWSAVCINEMEYMQTAADGFPDDIGVYGLLYEDATSTPEACAELMESAGYTYDCIRLDSVLGALVSEYNMIPQTFIVNNQGVVVEHFVGEFENYGQLEQRIEHWLGYSEQNCTITFIDGLTDEIISQANIPVGGSAVPPIPPEHEGYEFLMWEGIYQNVQHSGNVYARYEAVEPITRPGDVDMDGIVSIADALVTARVALELIEHDGVAQYGDLDNDGRITIADALLIARIAIGVA